MSSTTAPAPDVLGPTEVAALAGVALSTVTAWVSRDRAGMPTPTKLAAGTVWDGPAMRAWLAENGYLDE